MNLSIELTNLRKAILLKCGDRANKYYFEKLLHEGKDSKLYDAKENDSITNEVFIAKEFNIINPVRIKNLHLNNTNLDIFFLMEVYILMKLNKHQIGPKLIDIWMTQSTGVILMEKYDGDLDDLFEQKHIPKEVFTSIVSQLSILQQMNILHLDLHPGNILYKKINNTIEVTITDFEGCLDFNLSETDIFNRFNIFPIFVPNYDLAYLMHNLRLMGKFQYQLMDEDEYNTLRRKYSKEMGWNHFAEIFTHENSAISKIPQSLVHHIGIIDLKRNWIDSMEGLAKYLYLREINLSTNSLKIISDINDLYYLEVLILNYNLIKEVSGIENLHNLQYLYLSNNRISALEIYLANLEVLHLDHNEIEDLSSIRINNIKSLKTLNLAGNRITKIQNINMYIETLYLSHNPISQLENIPESVIYFNIEATKILKLENLPPKIKTVYAGFNDHLTEVLPFPPTLTTLDIMCCKLLNHHSLHSQYPNIITYS
jgi:Leucine-rich repeat (LRR) protein